MIIQNVESLRSWLTGKLEPVCDADPAALAKYVVALVKKDKSPDELKDVCIDQLDVFLGDETRQFVNVLFDALETQSYLSKPPSPVEVKKEDLTPEGQEEGLIDDDKGDDRENIREHNNENVKENDTAVTSDEKPKDQTETAEDVEAVLPSLNNDELNTLSEPGRKRRGNENRTDSQTGDYTSSSRSHKHSRKESKEPGELFNDLTSNRHRGNDLDRTVSRGRSRRSASPLRHRISASPGRRSPRRDSPTRRHRHRTRKRRERSEERRSSRKRGRCRDYEDKGFCILGDRCPFDHGKDPVVVDDLNFPGMIGMPLPGRTAASADLFSSLLPNSASNLLPIQPLLPSSIGLSMNTGVTLVPGQPRPVPSPVELPPRVPIYQSQTQPPLPDVPPPPKPDPPRPGNGATSGSEAYNPEQPSIDFDPEKPKPPVWMRLGPKATPTAIDMAVRNRELLNLTNSFKTGHPGGLDSDLSRKLYTPSATLTLPTSLPTPVALSVSLPSVSQITAPIGVPNVVGIPPPVGGMPPPVGVPGPVGVPAPVGMAVPVPTCIASRVPVRRPFMNQTILECRNLPANLNNIATLSEYFQKFGRVVNIQIQHDNDSQAALVQFASNPEARRAYTCPEAVLGNRFIKLFWHRGKELQQGSGAITSVAPSQPVTTVAPVTNNTIAKPAAPPPIEKPKLPSTGETTYVNPENTPKAIQKRKAEKRQEVLKKKLELQKQRQLLLEKQIKEQKVLITKLEKSKNMNSNEKASLMKALKALTNSIDTVRKDIENETKAAQKKSKEAIQKELLDKELDLINQQYSGEDTSEIKHKMEELKREAQTLGVANTSHLVRGRGIGRSRSTLRGTIRGRGRGRGRGWTGSTAGAATLDNRPKQLLVTNYLPDDKDAVVAHFTEVGGEIDRVEEKTGDKLILTFHTRKQAEIAASKASLYKGKKLVLAWYNPAKRPSSSNDSSTEPAPAKIQRTRKSSSSSLLGKDEEGSIGDIDEKEEDLLLLEEDEEEDQDRSWKR